jgi:hypothetical protein
MTLLTCLIASSALCTAPASTTPPVGRYVEARSASVYAGACHYNSEYVTQGREAALAWRVERGVHAGVDVAGWAIAAVIVDDVNLDQPASSRRSVVYLPASADGLVQAALCDWLLDAHAEQLGEVVAIRTVELAVRAEPSGFDISSPGELELHGGPLPNSECCKMPYNVWYQPFERVVERRVGHADEFRLLVRGLGAELLRRDENCVYTGWFGTAPATRVDALAQR